MARKSLVFLALGTIFFLVASLSSADVPHMISYQGKLTTASGGCFSDTVQMVFSIYPDTLGSPADWSETQMQVVVQEGIFNVLLGAVDTIPQAVFDGSVKYLGVQVESDPEMRPLKPMVSVAYAYRAASADGGGGGLNCHDCDTVFVNTAGPDSVVATSGIAFLGKVSGSSADTLFGIKGYAENSSDGRAYGGFFTTSPQGTGDHYGLYSFANSDYQWGDSYGIYAKARGKSSYGGYFVADSNSITGIGDQCGVVAVARSNNSTSLYGTRGVRASAYNLGGGDVFGITARADGTSSNGVYGVIAGVDNWDEGDAYGGYFYTGFQGSGLHYGVYAESQSYATSENYGSYGYANNRSTGDCFGGYFLADDEGYGTDSHHGVRGEGNGSASQPNYGVWGYAENTSTGGARGGTFAVSSSGTGTHYGVYGSETAGGGGAAVYASGDMIASGAKPCVVKLSKGHRLLYAQESPEIWFEDFGEGRLENGKAHIELDPLFLETVTINADHPMKVFVQVDNEDCKGTAVKRGTTGFDVIELQQGTSNTSFSYRIVAKRKGYENERMRETDVGYDDPTLYPELQAEIDKARQEERQLQQAQQEKRRQEDEQRKEEQRQMEEESLR